MRGTPPRPALGREEGLFTTGTFLLSELDGVPLIAELGGRILCATLAYLRSRLEHMFETE